MLLFPGLVTSSHCPRKLERWHWRPCFLKRFFIVSTPRSSEHSLREVEKLGFKHVNWLNLRLNFPSLRTTMSNGNNFHKVNLVAAFSISILSFLFLIKTINSIHIPLEKTGLGIVSLATTTHTSPYTNYVKFFLLLLIPSLIGIIVLTIKQELINECWRIVTRITEKLFLLWSSTRFRTAFILALVFLWTINKNYNYLDWPLTDTFHEGEYLGFLPNFLDLKSPFLRSFMIHGFGLDVLTSLIASKLSNEFSGNTIALTRFFRMTQGAIGYFCCYWIIWEIVSSIKFSTSKQAIFFSSSIVFTILDRVYYEYFTDVFTGRDSLFLIQLALVIRFFRITNISESYKTEKRVLPVVIGVSIPVSFLYVYDRAAYFLLVYLFTCSLSIYFGQKFLSRLFFKSTLGLVTSLILIVTVLGLEQAFEVLSQILFWVRYGRYISFNALPPFSRESFPIWSYFSSAILTQIFAVLYLIANYKKAPNLSTLLRAKFLLIILLFSSLVYMRIALDRPNNVNYVGSGCLISTLLLIYLGLDLLKMFFENYASKIVLEPVSRYLTISFVALIIFFHPLLNPFVSLDNLRRIYTTYNTSDVEIIKPELLQAYNTLNPTVSQSSCFFTLTQEAFWYYLFNKPSCSKFSIIFYARTQKAQETVVQEIDIRKPSTILFSSTSRASTFEGISTADAVPIIYQHFLNHYKPYKLEESQWFWQRNENKLTFKHDKSRYSYGSINPLLNERIIKGTSVFLSGAAEFPQQSKSADAVYLTYGEDNQMVEVTKVDNSKWSVAIPTISLPTGKGTLRVWSYAANTSQLVQIGEDIRVELIDRFGSQEAA